MTINILFNERIIWMEGSFVIHGTNGKLLYHVTRISELGESLRYTLSDTAGEYRMPLDVVDHVEILNYKDIKFAR